MQGADEVVMAFPVLVVNRGALLDNFQQCVRAQHFIGLAEVKDAFHQVNEVASVSVCQFYQGGARFRRERQFSLKKGFRPFNDAFQSRGVQGVHDKDFAAGEEGAVQFKGGVFRSGPHQRNGSVFHIWQKTVLLGAVEPMYFIHEQEGPMAVFPAPGRFVKGFSQIRHAGEDGGESCEMHGRARRQNARQRGFSAAGRPPQNKAGHLAGVRHEPERSSFPQQMILAHDVFQCGRPQAVRQRAVREGGKQARGVVFFHDAHHTPPVKGRQGEPAGISGGPARRHFVERMLHPGFDGWKRSWGEKERFLGKTVYIEHDVQTCFPCVSFSVFRLMRRGRECSGSDNTPARVREGGGQGGGNAREAG